MASGWFSCKTCSSSDPTQDTVKVDASKLISDKENVSPTQVPKTIDDAKVQQRLAQTKAKKEAEERRQAEEEETRRRRKEQEAAETHRRKEEAAAAVAAAAAAAAAAEERQRQERQRAAEEDAKKAAEAALMARKAEEERKHAEEELRVMQEKVDAWCKSNGYENMNVQKQTFKRATKFPLHTAVKHQNVEMVEFLVKCGADKEAKDSKGQRPADLATKMNKNGSHEQILATLN